MIGRLLNRFLNGPQPRRRSPESMKIWFDSMDIQRETIAEIRAIDPYQAAQQEVRMAASLHEGPYAPEDRAALWHYFLTGEKHEVVPGHSWRNSPVIISERLSASLPYPWGTAHGRAD